MSDQEKPDVTEITSLFLRHKDTSIISKQTGLPEQVIKTLLRHHKKEISHLVDTFDDIQLVINDDGTIDVEKTMESVTSATVSMVKDRHSAFEPIELTMALKETRQQLEALHKMKGPALPSELHLHQHNDIAQTIINQIFRGKGKIPLEVVDEPHPEE